MRKIYFFIFLLFSSSLFAQFPMGGMPSGAAAGNSKFKMPQIGRVYGTIRDKKSKDHVGFASVALFKGDSAIAGCFTKNNGDFSLDNLPFGRFTLKVSFVGYKPYQQNVTINPQTIEQDLGNISIESDETVLKTVEIAEEKSASQMTIDRKVYNVDKDLSGRGGTAVDIIKNIPAVTVDNDGNAQLRQNNAQIYIDGRPTTLTLNQIPSDQIDRVEIITNPSAKFEASATGGILNIVMKKNTKPGYNGVVSAGVGTNKRYNGMVSLNVKQSPIGMSLTYNYNTFRNPVTGYTYRTNLSNGQVLNYFDQDNITDFRNTMQFGRLGFDYNINNRNTLTLSENIMHGEFDSFDDQNFSIKDAGKNTLSSGTRTTDALSYFSNYTTQLQYKKTFPKPGKELTADANYNFSNGHNNSDFETKNYDINGTLYPNNPDIQRNRGSSHNDMFTFQSDYINPLSDSSKLELGVRSNYKITRQILDVSNYNYASDAYISNQAQTTDYLINDMINAAYINYANRFKTINYMTGLRFEQSYYVGNLKNKNTSFSYNYPSKLDNIMNALFPSIFLGKKFNTKYEWQFNLSRKLNRPGFMQLMPFIMFSDKQNYRIGNPNLTPEFTNLAELNFNQTYSKGNILSSLFFRNTTNPITNYSYRYPADSSILINTFINGNMSNTLGMDNTFKYTLFKGFEATWNINLYYLWIDAEFNSMNYSNKGFNYTTKLNLKYTLPKDISVQVNGNYESPRVIPQGTSNQQYFMDASINKDLMKMMSFTFSVSDVFNTKRHGAHYETPDYIQDFSRRRESRYFKLTVMIRFGKVDASLFKNRGKRPGQQQQGGSQDGLDF